MFSLSIHPDVIRTWSASKSSGRIQNVVDARQVKFAGDAKVPLSRIFVGGSAQLQVRRVPLRLGQFLSDKLCRRENLGIGIARVVKQQSRLDRKRQRT